MNTKNMTAVEVAARPDVPVHIKQAALIVRGAFKRILEADKLKSPEKDDEEWIEED